MAPLAGVGAREAEVPARVVVVARALGWVVAVVGSMEGHSAVDGGRAAVRGGHTAVGACWEQQAVR